MSKLMIAVYLALLICPFIAIIFTEPFVYFQYRKNDIIDVVRCAQFYLLITFTLCAYFLTMLPFPSIESVAKLTSPRSQLIPFYWVYDLGTNSGIEIADWKTVFPALKSGIMLGVVFNILMLFPSGFLARSLYKIDFLKTCLIGFIISLIFELTQLSGLFFIYPRPYRVFDVDDLIQNTLGFVFGAAVAFFIESRNANNANLTIRQGGEVSFRRRFKVDVIDQTILLLITIGLIIFLNKQYPFFKNHPYRSFPVYFLLIIVLNEVLAIITYATNGKSLGMQIIGLRLRDIDGNRISLSQCIARDFVYAICFNIPLLIGWFILLSQNRRIIVSILCTSISALLVFLYTCFLLSIALYVITHGEKMIYEKLSNTHLGLDENIPVRKRQRVLYRNRLTTDAIDLASAEVNKILGFCSVGMDDRIKMRMLVEEALVKWMEDGLWGHNFTVQIDNRRNRRVLLICVPGKRVDLSGRDDDFIDRITPVRMSFDSYYTGGINVFAIEMDK